MTPGEIWYRTPYIHHRRAIFNALQVDGSDPSAGFACACFRSIADDGINYIAGAVGCPPHLDLDRFRDWTPDRIAHVILWHPKSNDVRELGEAKSQSILIAPTIPDETITVYADGFAFFRAWIERRAAHYVRNQMTIRKEWAHPTPETSDSLIPGALVIGNIASVKEWPAISESALIAGPGVTDDALRQSVWRSAHIPQVITRNIRKVAA